MVQITQPNTRTVMVVAYTHALHVAASRSSHLRCIRTLGHLQTNSRTPIASLSKQVILTTGASPCPVNTRTGHTTPFRVLQQLCVCSASVHGQTCIDRTQ